MGAGQGKFDLLAAQNLLKIKSLRNLLKDVNIVNCRGTTRRRGRLMKMESRVNRDSILIYIAVVIH